MVLLPLLSASLTMAAPATTSRAGARPEPVFVVDFVRTLPDQYGRALRLLRAKGEWVDARKEAKRRRAIVSYRVLALGEMPDAPWNLLLVTEYADARSQAGAEAAFARIFKDVRAFPQERARIDGREPGEIWRVVSTSVLTILDGFGG